MIINNKKLLIIKQILLVCTLRNVFSTVWRICILTLGCNGLKTPNVESRKNGCQMKKVEKFICLENLFVWRIYLFGEFISLENMVLTTNHLLIDVFLYFHHFSTWPCIDFVGKKFCLSHSWKLKNYLHLLANS